MSNLRQYRAAVIGGGMIGALMKGEDNSLPLTHADGYRLHEGFELCGICEPMPDASLHEYSCPVYAEVQDLIEKQRPDIVSVAVSKDKQFEILKYLAHSGVRAVIAEKPLAEDLEKAREIVDLFALNNIPLLVNYSRRYSTMYRNFSTIFQGEEEKVLGATISYGKGLLHNGSHAVDLACMLFGKCLSAKALMRRVDFDANDPSVSVFMTFEHCPQLLLQALDERCFTQFMVDIITTKGRYVIDNDHRDLHIWQVKQDVGLPAGRRLVFQGTQKTDYDFVMITLMENAHQVLDGNAAPLCEGKDVLLAMRIIEDIRRDLRGV